MTNLVKVIDRIPVVSTLDMFAGLDVEHRALIALVKKYESEFQDIRTFTFQMLKSGGKPTPYCYLDEEQATFLVTLMRNNPIVVSFKRKLTREFYRQKKILSALASQQQNAQWLEDRRAGKITRAMETDRIKDFIDYATAQGSTKASFYYATISKMQNRALFLLEQKFPNLRDILDIHQLGTIREADEIVIKALKDGMDSGLHYREIYQLAKGRVETFAEIRGKSIIPRLQIATNEQRQLN